MNFKQIIQILDLQKEELERIPHSELVRLLCEIKPLLYDPLTGLRDRRQFSEGIEHIVENNTSFVLFDIDNFKRINDTYGHNMGDMVISLIARTIKDNTSFSGKRSPDTIRYGGEEFLTILPETGIYSAEIYANRILEQVRKLEVNLPDLSKLKVTLSAGVSHFDRDYNFQKDKIQMVMEADLALYLSKKMGKDRVTMFGGAIFEKSS